MNRLLVSLCASVIILISSLNNSYGQAAISPREMEALHKMEDSLVVLADSMFKAFIPDTRTGYSQRFARQLVRALKIPNSYLYPFDTLRKVLNVIAPDDNSFRVFNWQINADENNTRYYGAIQFPSRDLKLIGLVDVSNSLGAGAEDSVLRGGKWFGAIYYRIMPQVINGRKIYTMFGLNASDELCNRKILDPMYFDTTGVVFGAPIFGKASPNYPRQRVNRFMLEYKKAVTASMNWDTERQMIVFDNLVSVTNDPRRHYTYVPSGQYDGLYWAEGLWNMRRNVIDVKILKDGEAPDADTEQ